MTELAVGTFVHESPVFDSRALERVDDLMIALTQSGELNAASYCVGHSQGIAHSRHFGRMGFEPDSPLITDDSLFLIASLTKPLVVAAAMVLVERGLIVLDDKVSAYRPSFAKNGKHDVLLRHLMTHTSGLPDMAPDNLALRARHAGLEEFLASIDAAPLDFAPGTRVSYQSTGIAMLGAVIHVVSGKPLPDFVRDEFFTPLGMNDTSLGAKAGSLDRIARVRLESDQEATDWNWNTPYWLGLGAPWGGLISTAVDYSRFCRMMLGEGKLDGVRCLSRATVRAMTTNQLAALPMIPEEERRCRPWGLGWRLSWPGQSAHFGDLLGPWTFGHWGATGTLCWIDPESDAFLVLFTTEPCEEEGRCVAKVSNVVAAAIVR